MNDWLNRLNLQPQERRLVLGGIVIVALVLNYWLIWPYFSEWSKLNADMAKVESRKTVYLGEINKKALYERQLKDLEKSGAGEVLEEDQDNRVTSTIFTQAATHNVTVIRNVPVGNPGATNLFFNEVARSVELIASEGDLVSFLQELGTGDSMIRVRDISRLRLDGSQTKLQTTLTLVASFQKKMKAVAPPSKPSTASVVKPKGPPPVLGTNKPVKK